MPSSEVERIEYCGLRDLYLRFLFDREDDAWLAKAIPGVGVIHLGFGPNAD